jgi:catechol 2,3-dioxygenase-like lactoylglutathione lyase family enzyme
MKEIDSMADYLVKGLAHVGVMTRDVDASMDFYVENLGFERYHIHTLPNGCKLGFVRCGDLVVEFIESGAQREKGTVDHVAIEVLGLDAMTEALKARGIVFDYDENHTVPDLFPSGSRMNFFTGPSGERIELYEYAGK